MLSPPLKIMFYSHNTRGFGHAARTLSLIWALHQRLPGATMLWCSGATRPVFDLLPPCADNVKLPSYTAVEHFGRIDLAPARLALPLPQVHALREDLLTAAARAFRPNVLIVDYLPLGKQNELLPAVQAIRALPHRLVCLGMREIMEDVPMTRRMLPRSVLDPVRAYFDRIFIYGDSQVFDTLREYAIPEEFHGICHPVGYVANRHVEWGDPVRVRATLGCGASDVLVVANFGGGKNARAMLDPVLAAWAMLPRLAPARAYRLVIVLGPYADAGLGAELRQRTGHMADVTVIEDMPWLIRLINAADLVIGTSSYNLAAEVLATGTPAIFMPHTRVDAEQLMRARALERFGYVVVEPGEEHPAPSVHIAEAVVRLTVDSPAPPAIMTDGADRVADHIVDWAGHLSGDTRY